MIEIDEYKGIVKGYNNAQILNALAAARDQNFGDREVMILDEMSKRGMHDPLGQSVNVCNDVAFADRYVKKSENAKSRGIDFDLTFSEYKRIVMRKNCYYTGIKLTNHNPVLPTHITIDRIDSTKGYTKDNCVGCANGVNAIKNAILEDPRAELRLTPKQLKKMAAKL